MDIVLFASFVKVIGIILLVSALIWASYLYGWQAVVILLMLEISHNIDRHFPTKNISEWRDIKDE
jgi:hypothetical protein